MKIISNTLNSTWFVKFLKPPNKDEFQEHYVREVRHKWPHTVWLYLCVIQGKTSDGKQINEGLGWRDMFKGKRKDVFNFLANAMDFLLWRNKKLDILIRLPFFKKKFFFILPEWHSFFPAAFWGVGWRDRNHLKSPIILDFTLIYLTK